MTLLFPFLISLNSVLVSPGLQLGPVDGREEMLRGQEVLI